MEGVPLQRGNTSTPHNDWHAGSRQCPCVRTAINHMYISYHRCLPDRHKETGHNSWCMPTHLDNDWVDGGTELKATLLEHEYTCVVDARTYGINIGRDKWERQGEVSSGHREENIMCIISQMQTTTKTHSNWYYSCVNSL